MSNELIPYRLILSGAIALLFCGCETQGTAGPSSASLMPTLLTAGSTQTCAVTAGKTWCWGGNETGQLGTGNEVSSTIPVAVSLFGQSIAAISVGGNPQWSGGGSTSAYVNSAASCVILAGGSVQCWGNNLTEQLGSGTQGGTLPFSAQPTQVVGLTSGATAIAVGAYHACAIVNGGVQCWGFGAENGSGGNSAVPLQVPGLTSGVTALAVARDGEHSCAIVSGGVQCWGNNSSGELGNGTTTASTSPVQVTGLTSGVTAIAVGGPGFGMGHSCAVVNGGVQCWGNNNAGQLGDGTTTQRTSPVQVTGLLSGATALSLGDEHTCAVVNGGVQCWGDNEVGQVGDGSFDGSPSTPTQVTGLTTGAVALASGSAHTCASLSVGGVVCWGDGQAGQLGNGTNELSTKPVTVLPGQQ